MSLRQFSTLTFSFFSILFLVFASLSSCTSDADLLSNPVMQMHQDQTEQWFPISSARPKAPEIVFSDREITITIPGFYYSIQFINQKYYSRITLPEHMTWQKQGYPELPRIRLNMLIPPKANVTSQVIDSLVVDLDVVPPIPSRGEILRNISPETVPYVENDFYDGTGLFPTNIYHLDSVFSLRGFYGQPIEINPIQYDPQNRKIQVHQQIRVTWNLDEPQNSMVYAYKRVQKEYSSLLNDTFINYRGTRATHDIASDQGNLLIITPEVFYDAIQPLKNWKLQRGLLTEIVKTSDLTNDSANGIKSFIRDRYFSEASLTYVILIGDGEFIPTLYGGYEGAACDPCYAMVDGDDLYPDLFVSRLSARTVAQVESQVAKFIAYERDPDVDGDWYQRGIGVASNEGNPTDWERAEELRVSLLNYGFDEVASIYAPNASKSAFIAKIEAGASVINYLGHGSGTSWSTTGFKFSDAMQLKNGNRNPFVIDVSCKNGAFLDHGACLAETWLRSGRVGSPGGAIAMYSASTNAAWVPPCVMQAAIIKDLLVTNIRFSTGGLMFGGMIKALNSLGTGSSGQRLVEQYNIFGDASLFIRSKKPLLLEVQYPSELSSTGPADFSVFEKTIRNSPLNNAVITMTYNDLLIAVAVTDSNGLASITYPSIELESLDDLVLITVTAPNAVPFMTELPVNSKDLPVAVAGNDQDVMEGDEVILDGSASYDNEERPLSFDWQQIEGPEIYIEQTTSEKLIFQAPAVFANTVIQFQLIVDNGEMTSKPDFVTITVNDLEGNAAPVANAGVDQEVTEGTLVELDGSLSFDDNGDVLTYSWIQVAGPYVVIAGADTVKASFDAPVVLEPSSLIFKLVVNDGLLNSQADEVTINIYSEVFESADTPLNISDTQTNGTESIIEVDKAGVIKSAKVHVEISYTSIEDLVVTLICPSGTKHVLHDQESDIYNTLDQTYEVDECAGGSVTGTWRLHVMDATSYDENDNSNSDDTGALNAWSLVIQTIPEH